MFWGTFKVYHFLLRFSILCSSVEWRAFAKLTVLLNVKGFYMYVAKMSDYVVVVKKLQNFEVLLQYLL